MDEMAIGKKDPRPSSRNDIPLNYPHRWPREGDFTRWVAPETSRARLVLLYIHSPTHTHPRPRVTHASDHRRPGLAAAPTPRPPRPGPARPHKRERPPGFPPEASRSVALVVRLQVQGEVTQSRHAEQDHKGRGGVEDAVAHGRSGSDQEEEQDDSEGDAKRDADQHASTSGREAMIAARTFSTALASVVHGASDMTGPK